jgi:murein DD-endopeptidase MepM/ murein hydrolase activator NlpD
VRNPVETPEGIVYSRFHEGIDIRPLQRDAAGEPLDSVHAIADGTVVYTNTVPGWSNYGNYIVIEHRWGGSSLYSLYGHLRSVSARKGEHVTRGQTIAAMGYTGEGLNRERAHLHLELNLMLSRNFDAWYATFVKNEPNHHGIYNGLNLTGIDIARLFIALRENPDLTIPQFLGKEETFYRIALPNAAQLYLAKAYPWLLTRDLSGANSCTVSFNAAGVPLKIEPVAADISQPQVVFARRHNGDYSLLTRGVLTGRGNDARLSESGFRQMQLLTWPDSSQ